MSTVSLFTRDFYVLPPHICPPLDNAPGHLGLPFGQLELPFGHLQMHVVHLQMHFVHLQMQFVHLQMQFTHLQMPFGHLELPGGVPRGPYDMSELPIENLGEYGDAVAVPKGLPKVDLRVSHSGCGANSGQPP